MEKATMIKIQEAIQAIMEGLEEDECSSEVAEFIAVEAVIVGASNGYEGIGIFESAKKQYLECLDNCICDDCRDKLEHYKDN